MKHSPSLQVKTVILQCSGNILHIVYSCNDCSFPLKYDFHVCQFLQVTTVWLNTRMQHLQMQTTLIPRELHLGYTKSCHKKCEDSNLMTLPKPFCLQAEQTHLPQPLLIYHIAQLPNRLSGLGPDKSQFINCILSKTGQIAPNTTSWVPETKN